MIQDDTTLVKRVLAGEKSAFGPLIERNSICMNRMLPAGSTAMTFVYQRLSCKEDFSQSCPCVSFGPLCFLVTL
jgi:hypothetical protein